MEARLVMLCSEAKIDRGLGFSLDVKLTEEELRLFRNLIEKQWLMVSRQACPEYIEEFYLKGMKNYHQLSHLLDHSVTWPKTVRILSKEAVDEIREMPFCRKLEDIFGPFLISDEENIGWEEIYWRLVRPNQLGDVGPLHADAWFWALGHGVTPKNMRRVKVWIAVYCEPGLNGLRVVPNSHKKEWRYHGETRNGFVKPQIDEKEEELAIQLVHTNPGDVIVFNDRLLHGGALNQGHFTRVSAEFTMFVKKD